MNTTKNTFDTEIYFHIGGGTVHGFFQRSGVKEFREECDFQRVINYNSNHLYVCNRGEKGRFVKPCYVDQNGKEVIDADDFNSKTGVANFDYDYDTDVVKMLSDCTDDELMLIYKSDRFMSRELREYVNQWARERICL